MNTPFCPSCVLLFCLFLFSLSLLLLSVVKNSQRCLFVLPSNNPAAAVPALSMEFAFMCLSNALLLLPPDPLDATEVTTTEDGDTRYVRHTSPLCFFFFFFWFFWFLTCICVIDRALGHLSWGNPGWLTGHYNPITPTITVLRWPCVVDKTLKSNYYYC